MPELCYFARVLLTWGALYGAKKARGATFVPFYSTKKENVSENRSKVARPQRETQILIEKGNTVVRPPCQYFFECGVTQAFIEKEYRVVRPTFDSWTSIKRKIV